MNFGLPETPKLVFPDSLRNFEPISVSQTKTVVKATGEVKDSINVLATSYARLETLTQALIDTSIDSNRQIAALASSSDKMEALTVKVKALTVWMMAIAIIQVVIAGVQTWKAFQPSPTLKVLVQYPPQTSPQTPPLPAP